MYTSSLEDCDASGRVDKLEEATSVWVANLQHQQHVSTRDTPSFDCFRSITVFLNPSLEITGTNCFQCIYHHTRCRFIYDLIKIYFYTRRMAATIYPDYPPVLDSEQLDYLLSNIKDWSILNGLAVRPSSSFVSEELDPSRCLAVTAPVTLFPSLFPRACFEEARAIQIAYNELYACIANNEEWLGEVVKEYACTFSMSPVPTTSCILGIFNQRAAI